MEEKEEVVMAEMEEQEVEEGVKGEAVVEEEEDKKCG